MDTFNTQIHCEEIAPEFIPTHNDLIDSLPPEMVEASYHETEADRLFAFGASLLVK